VTKIEVIPVEGLPVIEKGDDLALLICQAAEKQGIPIQDGDVIVVTHVIVSRAEGSVIDLNNVSPSEQAKAVAEKTGKDPKLVEVILRESKQIVRMQHGKLITETQNGLVCANAGVDLSNVPGENCVALLPKDADSSARKIREGIMQLTGRRVAIIVSDTHGRPFRQGEVNIALGVSGMEPLRDRRGEKDLFGYTIQVKRTAVADELASAAELVMGQTNEAVPVALIRGYSYSASEKTTSRRLIRPREKDMFR